MYSQRELKEYVFFSPAGYRHFFVFGLDLRNAEANFMQLDDLVRCGFTLDDLPIRLEYVKEKCKHWSMDDYREHNENRDVVKVS
jgi:hypothetical protein